MADLCLRKSGRFTQAVEWYRKAAEQGFAKAQYNLGVMYENGTGISRDYTQAADWFVKAGDQGHALALCELGSMREKGLGFPINFAAADMFMIFATADGHTCQDRRSKLEARMTADKLNAAKAAAKGVSNSQGKN